MKKKEYTLFQSAGRCYDEDGYNYEAYVEYCQDNGREPEDEGSQDYWDWVSDMAELDYDDFFGNLKYANGDKGMYMITFNLGLWNGHRIGYVEEIYKSMTEAIKAALNSSRDYLDYKVTYEDGEVVVYGYHHDGTNVMHIKQLSKHGERNLAYTRFPDFEKYVNNKDTFKRIKENFEWE